MPRSSSKSTKPTIEAIIFDLGRVIVRLEPLRALATIGASAIGSPTNLPPEKMWGAIQKDPLWASWQQGRVTPQDWYENLTTRFHARITFKKFCAAWNSVIVPEPDLLLPDRLFASLSRRYRLVLLSNTDPLHVEHLESRFRFMRHFPARVYSCAVGACKPSRTIFRAAIRAAETQPDRILYIDDIRAYVLAGRRLGMHAIQFRTRPQLEAALRLPGFLSPST
jgi:putative hydrolase of the HAD superfamily